MSRFATVRLSEDSIIGFEHHLQTLTFHPDLCYCGNTKQDREKQKQYQHQKGFAPAVRVYMCMSLCA